jgi:hypothetical protein
MRIKKQQEIVRPVTTGHVEADMLGTVYLWLSERSNSKYPQRPHRTYKRKSKLRVAVECIQTAPSACLRSLKVLKGKGKEIYSRVANKMRKQFRNGK